MFDDKIRQKQADPNFKTIPSTLEGCVVRLADTIAYIGRDIEDAIILGLIKRTDIPQDCRTLLGDTNGTIVYSLVTDMLTNSRVPQPGEEVDPSGCIIRFSEEISEALRELKKFNYERIYLAPETKKNYDIIRNCYHDLFRFYMEYLSKDYEENNLQVDLMRDIKRAYSGTTSYAEMVRDFIAGMTDDFFISQAAKIGCNIPERI